MAEQQPEALSLAQELRDLDAGRNYDTPLSRAADMLENYHAELSRLQAGGGTSRAMLDGAFANGFGYMCGRHKNPTSHEAVQEAMRASTKALLALQAAGGQGVVLPKGFLSDVLTAAGLVRHGKQCKALADRLGDYYSQIKAHPPAASTKVLVPLSDKQKSEIFLLATGEPDYSTRVADAVIAEFCRINGLTVTAPVDIEKDPP